MKYPPTIINIPAQAMIEFRDELTSLVEEFGSDDDDSIKGNDNRISNSNLQYSF